MKATEESGGKIGRAVPQQSGERSGSLRGQQDQSSSGVRHGTLNHKERDLSPWREEEVFFSLFCLPTILLYFQPAISYCQLNLIN